MRIWIVNQYAIPPQQAGPMRHFTMAQHLTKMGHDVTIIASSFDHVTQQETRLHGNAEYIEENIEGVKFLWIKTPSYSGNGVKRIINMIIFSIKVFLNSSRVINSRPDSIIGSSPHLLSALSSFFLSKRLHVPFILEVRDLWPQSLVDLAGVSERHPLVVSLKIIEKYLYVNANHIITLLPGAHVPIVKRGAQREKITWVPNGVDLSMVPAIKSPETSKISLMYAGTHGMANGLDLLIDAAKIIQNDSSMQNIEFILLGDGPLKSGLMDRVKNENINIVKFIDPVPKKEVYNELMQASGFLLILQDSPVFQWGVSPNKLFDYLAMERPVIFGVNTEYNPVSESKSGITFDPSSAGSLVEAIKIFSDTSPAERKRMGRLGREHVERYYEYSILSQKLLECVQLAKTNYTNSR